MQVHANAIVDAKLQSPAFQKKDRSLKLISIMSHQVLILAIILLHLQHCFSNSESQSPHEQVHISLGSLANEMVITWVTLQKYRSSYVKYGTSTNLDQTSSAESTYFSTDKFYTHRALLSSLTLGTVYYYSVGSDGGEPWSELFRFKTFPSGDWFPRIIIYGDLGWQNQESLPFLEKELDQGGYDVVFHVGDLAYDLHDLRGLKGHLFMRSIEKIASRVPYMTCPGNHERTNNFTHYDARMSMLGDYLNPKPKAHLTSRINNHYFSVDIGPVHFIMFSTEFYIYTKWGWNQIREQYEWLVADLKKANQNRAKRPWIIVMGHRPMYCLRLGDSESCLEDSMERPKLRKGIDWKEKGGELQYGLEKLFYEQGVDLQFYAHEHYYARLMPIYEHQVMGGYADPRAPIHVTTGSAGNRELHPAFNPIPAAFVGKRSLDYGYTRLLFKDSGSSSSKYELDMEQTSIDQDNKVVDQVHISKSAALPAWLQKSQSGQW